MTAPAPPDPPSAPAPPTSASLRLSRRRVTLALLGVAAIVTWQHGISLASDGLENEYRVTASQGAFAAAQFVYFYHYLNLLPVAPLHSELDYSKEGALRMLREQPQNLVMDLTFTFRSGDRGKVFPFLFGAWLSGRPDFPHPAPFHSLVFTTALCGLYLACWVVRHTGLGALLVVFLGSNPLQLYAVYEQPNLFSWPISTAIACLAMCIPLVGLRAPPPLWLWSTPLLAGAVLASVRTIRPEPVPMIATVALVLLTVPGRLGWLRRASLLGALIASFALIGAAWNQWFEAKFQQAHTVLTQAGGHPYPGPYNAYHEVWHPIWCGLGDFDEKYGYRWDDMTAYAYATPILETEFQLELPERPENDYFFVEAWDEAGHYPRIIQEFPEYHRVIQRKVLRDIRGDPLWYLDILRKRAWRILDEATPLRVAWGARHVELPFHAALAVPLVLWLLATRNWPMLKIAILTAPTLLTAFAIYSGQGTQWYGVVHLVAAALIASLAADALRVRLARTP